MAVETTPNFFSRRNRAAMMAPPMRNADDEGVGGDGGQRRGQTGEQETLEGGEGGDDEGGHGSGEVGHAHCHLGDVAGAEPFHDVGAPADGVAEPPKFAFGGVDRPGDVFGGSARVGCHAARFFADVGGHLFGAGPDVVEAFEEVGLVAGEECLDFVAHRTPLSVARSARARSMPVRMSVRFFVQDGHM